jgi:hypothetical protein
VTGDLPRLPAITRLIGTTVLASIPALFSDGACRPYRLVGAELNGLWLQASELTERLVRDEMREIADTEPVAFVPFTQIAAVLIPTTPPKESTSRGPPAASPRRGTPRRSPGTAFRGKAEKGSSTPSRRKSAATKPRRTGGKPSADEGGDSA